jgi:hypothetical protein
LFHGLNNERQKEQWLHAIEKLKFKALRFEKMDTFCLLLKNGQKNITLFLSAIFSKITERKSVIPILV